MCFFQYKVQHHPKQNQYASNIFAPLSFSHWQNLPTNCACVLKVLVRKNTYKNIGHFPLALRIPTISAVFFFSAAHNVPAIISMSSIGLIFLFTRTQGHWGYFHLQRVFHLTLTMLIGNPNSPHSLPHPPSKDGNNSVKVIHHFFP